jgi:hypothetical protein
MSRNLHKWALVLVVPMMVVALPVIAVVEWRNPWSVAEHEMRKQYPDVWPLCTGGSSSWSQSGRLEVAMESRSYLLLNKGILFSVTEATKDGRKSVDSETSRWAFWIILALYGAFIGISVRICIPKIRSRIRDSIIRYTAAHQVLKWAGSKIPYSIFENRP